MTRHGDCTLGSPDTQGVRTPDLVRLDRDLREIEIEERSSFGAELRAELAAEHARLSSATPPRSVRVLPARLAATAGVVLLAGALLVPTARASLGRLLLAEPERVDPVLEAELGPVDPLGDAYLPAVPVEGVPPETETRDHVSAPPPWPEIEGVLDGPLPPLPTLPDLLDRERARRTVRAEYPVSFQQAGIGGVVRVLLWVRPDGVPETPRVRDSSGVPALDQAALRAVHSMRFVPTTRAGLPVGTWVEFSIRFVPNATGSQPDPGFQAFEIPQIN